jgi:hypothetical protein
MAGSGHRCKECRAVECRITRGSAAKARLTPSGGLTRSSRLRRLQALVRLRTAYQWESLWMIQRLDSQVDVQEGPVQMMGTREFHFDQVPDRSVTKPREVLEGYEVLLLLDEQPEAMR